MTSLKRKALEQLTRGDILEDNKPVPYQRIATMSWRARFTSFSDSLRNYLFEPTAPNQPARADHPPAEITKDSITGMLLIIAQDSYADKMAERSREIPRILDHTTSPKRRKTTEQQSPALVTEHKHAHKKSTDVSHCKDEGEARECLDDFWLPGNVLLPTSKPKLYRPPTPESTRESSLASGRIDAEPKENYTDSSKPPNKPEPLLPQKQGWELYDTWPKTPHTPRADFKESTSGRTPSSHRSDPNEIRDRLENLLLENEGDLTRSEYKSVESGRRREAREQKRKADAIRRAQQARLTRRFPTGDLVQELPFKWAQVVNETSGKNALMTITKSMGGTELRVKDFNTLLGHRAWLNDEIINTYIEWVVEAANEAATEQIKLLGEIPTTVPKFIAHNSFFYENLKKKGASSTERLMKRKKAPGASLLEVDSVFVPICSHNHWTIGVVRPVAKTIEYFDSMGGNSAIFVKYMRAWLEFQLGKAYIASEWNEPNTRCAHQTNGYDCGVFVCTNAFCVATGFDTSCYREKDMMKQRRNIAAVLINRGFREDFAWREGWELPLP